ncbi:MAG: hypothetical protein ABIP35_09015 [Ginsengibacter sp.]
MENKNLIKTSKRHQFEMENESWKRSLEFIRQENALLKYRLSEIVDGNEDGELLTVAEFFQNEFISNDEQNSGLIKLIGQFSGELFESSAEDFLSQKMIQQHEKLRNEIVEFEKNFLQTSLDFNKRMLGSV